MLECCGPGIHRRSCDVASQTEAADEALRAASVFLSGPPARQTLLVLLQWAGGALRCRASGTGG